MGFTMDAYTIYGDNRIEAFWFKNLSSRLSTAVFRKIGDRSTNTAQIESLIRYDRPDIILCSDGQPILVLEKTREVPTGHNVGQRMARLVRSIELKIPTIFYCPFDAMKHGDYAGMCNLNIRLLKAFQRMTEIHGTPILAVNWPCDAYGELVDDGAENERIAAIIGSYLIDLDPLSPEFQAQQEIMQTEYEARIRRHPPYGRPPPSVKLMLTKDFLANYPGKVSSEAARSLTKRGKTLVYTMEMTPDNCRREDPYTGTQFIYDYIWCRNGPRPEDKHTNLVLCFPRITKMVWYTQNPNDQSRKSCNWYLTANALAFADTIDVLR